MRRSRVFLSDPLEGLRVHRRHVGHVLPEGLQESEQLPEPIFTPSTKAHEGHDENIDADRAAELVGRDLLDQVDARRWRCTRMRPSTPENAGS